MIKKVMILIIIVIGLINIENLKANPTGLDGDPEISFNAWWAEQAFWEIFIRTQGRIWMPGTGVSFNITDP